ncbi:MAG: putative ester cyclase [Deltaproteobacteria bacterium]|nr:putative ester cyclase [Deltaproteobacteria bacterium]
MLDKVKKHLEFLAAGDWKEYRAALADNAIYEEVPTRQRVEGADQYVSLIQRWKKAFPDLRATVLGGIEAGDTAMVELEWEGTHRGSLEAPFGTIAATNKAGRIRGVLVVKFQNDKMIESRHYFDLYSLMSQLGIAPGLGAVPQARPVEAPKHT